MVVVRKRLIIWLIKAYIKKSGKTMLISFLVGLVIFFGLFYLSKNFSANLPIARKSIIGVVGAYTQDNLPPLVINKLSRGLTKIAPDGSIQPDIASSWTETNNGKTFTFQLNHTMYFNDGKNVTSDLLSYNFSDVTISRPDKYTITFTLKDSYSPFLATVSRPVFEKGYIGVGTYKIQDIKLNGNFVQTLTLVSAKNRFDIIHYQFYPTEEVMKTAYILGEITQAEGLTENKYKNKQLETFPNTIIHKDTDYTHLVTLFYNTSPDSSMNDKKIRLALSYALPDNFSEGEKAYLPYPPTSIYYNKIITPKTQDFAHAKILLSSAGSGSGSAAMQPLTIKVLTKYVPAANEIAALWQQIGIPTKVEEVDSVPTDFQIFLGDFRLPNDPDQYTLWHSSQSQFTNITRYKNVRIDKLLEDGRKTTDIDQRKQDYDSFQKYLMEDTPASFLYFPYTYEVVRK